MLQMGKKEKRKKKKERIAKNLKMHNKGSLQPTAHHQ